MTTRFSESLVILTGLGTCSVHEAQGKYLSYA